MSLPGGRGKAPDMRPRFATLLLWMALALCSANTARAQNLTSFTVSPSTVIGGVASTGTVVLNSNNGADGTIVYLTSNNTSAATVPSQILLPYHVTTKNF